MKLRLPVYTLKRRTDVRRWKQDSKTLDFIRAVKNSGGGNADWLKLIDRSKSSAFQELYALAKSNFRRDGFFVEFGALDGLEGSNSWMLENDYSWQGILAEPQKLCQTALRQNRQCHIDTRCVWSSSGEQIFFTENDNKISSGITETLTKPAQKHSKKWNTRTYSVETISLNDLLTKYSAPQYIDYISIDTEGSEFDILNTFDFNRWRFGFISVEHHFQPQRQSINKLLTAHGYRRTNTELSGIDDWYISE